jgi:3-phenylpropionate/trans-cinnamate dioxygenase ferredoxin reductase subunit
MNHSDVLIVGAGHAGAQTAIALRQNKFAGSISIVGAESELPYERPPLSKEYLSEEKTFDRILIRPAPFWAERDITMVPGVRIAQVLPDEHIAVAADGSRFHYGQLVWATGGAPRRLMCAGNALQGVHQVRNRADVDRMRTELPHVERVVVIGGGYIGLESAAVLNKAGKSVTVLEAQDRVLARVAGEPLSRFFEAQHRAHGVKIRLGVSVDCLEGQDGKLTGVRLADGEVLAADLVVVGIGIIPAVAPLTDAGAAGAPGVQGVAVDAYCRTSLADVFAVGDCAAHENKFAGGSVIRVESVQNANDQASTVAKFLTGASVPYDAVPWFWSNQYELRLQTVGLSVGHDQVVQRGEPASLSFSVIYLRQGRVIALDCVNATKDFVQGRTLVVQQTAASPADLANPDLPLKQLALPPAPVASAERSSIA